MKDQRITRPVDTRQEAKDLGVVLRHLRRTHRITKDELGLLLRADRHIILFRERGSIGLMTLEGLAVTATCFDLTLSEFTSVALRVTAQRRGSLTDFQTRAYLSDELLRYSERTVASADAATQPYSGRGADATEGSPKEPEKHHWCYAMKAPRNHRFEPLERSPSTHTRLPPPAEPPPKDLDYAALGRTLYLLRRQARISRTEVGRVFGIGAHAVQRIELGLNADSTWQRLPTLCSIYRTTVSDVLSVDHDAIIRRFGDDDGERQPPAPATDVPAFAARIAYMLRTSGRTRVAFRTQADVCKQALQHALSPSVGSSRLATILRLTTIAGFTLGDLCSDDCGRAVEEAWPVAQLQTIRNRRSALEARPVARLTSMIDWIERDSRVASRG